MKCNLVFFALIFPLCLFSQVTPCNDGIDNDGDGLIDWQYDLGCYGANDTTERGAYTSTHLNGSLPQVDIGPYNTFTENGWTTIDPSIDTKIIYVSSSTGNDTANGLTPATAVKTIDKGYSLLRDSMPDWLLLKRGDVWNSENVGPASGWWKKHGRSHSERIVVSSYGDSLTRPQLIDGQWRNRTSTPVNFCAVMGIEFYARVHDPSSAFYASPFNFSAVDRLAPGNGFFLEDCAFKFGSIVMDINGSLGNLVIRRCVVTDNFSDTSGHSQGSFISDLSDSSLIEENIYDANGWYYPDGDAGIGKTSWFNHNFYLKGVKGLVARNNLLARPSGANIKTSSDHYHNFRDFVYENNLFIGGDGPVSLNWSGGVQDSAPTHYKFQIIKNVMTRSGRTYIKNNNANRAHGVRVYTGEDGLIQGNYFVHKDFALAGDGVVTIGSGSYTNIDIDVSDNIIFNWLDNNPLRLTGAPSTNVTFSNNIVNTDSNFVDTTRSVETYSAMLGNAPTIDAFMLKARMQSRFNWDSSYTSHNANCYIKAGFCHKTDLVKAGFTYSQSVNQVAFLDTAKLVDTNNICFVPMKWSFGDGQVSYERNPSHIYASPGTYTVTQVAGNACGTDTAQAVIIILGTSIIEQSSLVAMQLFPNPIKSSLQLRANVQDERQVTISVNNSIGEELYSSIQRTSGILNKTIELGHLQLPNGVYFLTLRGERTFVAKPFYILK